VGGHDWDWSAPATGATTSASSGPSPAAGASAGLRRWLGIAPPDFRAWWTRKSGQKETDQR